MSYSLYFNSVTNAFGTGSTAEKWHLVAKVGNTFNNTLSTELVFRYYPNATGFDITGKHMVLFNMGTDTTKPGIAIILKKGANQADPIQVGLLYNLTNNGTWTELAASFVSLNSIGNVLNDAYYCLLTYTTSGANKIVNFYVAEYNSTTTKTTPDFTMPTQSLSFSPSQQLGFGCSPEPTTTTDGLLSTGSYNCYVAQNTELSFLRCWSINIPATSTGTTTYAMFNSAAPAYSLYRLNKLYTQVPSATTGLQFQLNVTGTPLSATTVFNSAVSPAVAVTVTASTSGVSPLSNFGINTGGATATYTISQPSNLPCLLKGTKILTDLGYKLIEDLTYDDILITVDDKKTNIVKILENTIFAKEYQIPYIVRKGQYNALEDLYISPKHSILIDNEYFVEADKLDLEKSGIKDQVITYYHIQTTDYFRDTIIANGVPVETYHTILDWNKDIPDEYKNKEGRRLFLKY